MEKIRTADDMQELILASGQEAMLLRAVPGERLYGSDDDTFGEIGTFPLKFVETLPEDLNNKINATACVLPALDGRPQDRVCSGTDVCRAQTIVGKHHFSV